MSKEALRALEACPFCGGAPSTIERPDNIDGTEFFYAVACYCGGHSACAHKMAKRKTPEQAKADAIAAWNRRAALSLLRAELEAGGEAEPVAWRYRYRARDDYPAGPWYLSDRELEMTPGQEIEPLYASPVATDTQGDAKLRELAKLADALVNPPQMTTGYYQRKQREEDEAALRAALEELK